MKYTEIIVKCENAEDRLNRKLLIRNDVDLLTMGYIILNTFNACMDKAFIIQGTDSHYTYHYSFMDFTKIPDLLGEEKELEEFGMSDIEDTFCISYPNLLDDTLWNLNCEIINRNVTHSGKQYYYIEEAVGLGIWEDAIQTYFLYINGGLKGNMKVTSLDERDLDFPDNLNIKYLKDTDNFDVNNFIKSFNSEDSEDLIDDIEDYCEFLDSEGMYDYDEDFDDELYDDEFDDDLDVRASIFGSVLYACMMQVDEIDFVKEAFERLMQKYDDPDYCMMLICKEFLEEFMNFIDPNNVKNLKEYKKRIEKLK